LGVEANFKKEFLQIVQAVAYQIEHDKAKGCDTYFDMPGPKLASTPPPEKLFNKE
jgi:hypothetical protein